MTVGKQSVGENLLKTLDLNTTRRSFASIRSRSKSTVLSSNKYNNHY